MALARGVPKIVVSYRRSDTAAMTGRICDQLVARYGAHSVFMDINNIPFGTDFRDHIRAQLAQSDLLLAIVGPRWRGATDRGTRIDAEDDPVRVEVELALAGGIPVIPVLVDGAVMPTAAELPGSINRFAFLNAAPVDMGRDFSHHIKRLIDSLDHLLEKKYRLPPRPGSEPPNLLSLDGLKGEARRPYLWGLLGALALPFGAASVAMTPPWPPGVTIIASVTVLVTFAFIHHHFRSSPCAATGRIAVAAAVLLALAGCAYLVAVSLYTYQTPTTRERWAKGLVCTTDALAVFKDKCPNLGNDELRTAEYEAERLWTSGSVTIVRVGLVVLWLLAFTALAALIASFALRPVRTTQRPKGNPALGVR